MAADFRTAQPLEYYKKFLKENIRPDGRALGQIRATRINLGHIGTADGSALVKLGNTTVVCGIKGEFAAPSISQPDEGFIVPNVTLPPLCSSRFKPGPPSDHAQVVSHLIANIITSSGLIDLKTLNIAKSQLSWVLHCDMLCLDYDGNIVDACLIALVAALKNVLLPSVTLDENTGLAVASQEKTVPLQLLSHPVSTSFMIFDDTILLVDPSLEEENLATGVVTVAINDDGRMCAMHKPGGSPLSPSKLQDCINRAKERSGEVRDLIEKTLNSIDR